MSNWTDDILRFWFDHVGPDRWFGTHHDIDDEIRERFEPLWHSLRHEKAIFFVASASDALAATILFDQFPRNMFRHEAGAFATDELALGITKLALDAGFAGPLDLRQKQFLYLPLMHSESLADQELSVELFEQLGEPQAFQFAVMHRDMIARFGRFPHRNEILGRETLPEELDAIQHGKDW